MPLRDGRSFNPNKAINRPSDPGPTHGGNFDPNEYISRSSDPGPSHGGNFDPNEYIGRSSGQTEGTGSFGYSATAPSGRGDVDPYSLVMASNAVQGASYQREGTHRSDRNIGTSNSIGTSPSADEEISMVDLESGSGRSTHRHDSSQALVEPSTVNDSVALPAAGNSSSSSINPNNSSRGARSNEGSSPVLFYHQDILKRPYQGPRDDRFLNPRDGRPSELKIQCTKEVLDKRSKATWTRTQVRNNSPRLFRLSYWATSKNAIVRWLPACGILAFVLLNPLAVTTKARNNGFYEAFPYKDWQYSYDARNEHENRPSQGKDDRRPQTTRSKTYQGRSLIGKIERKSEPAYVCLVDGMQRINVAEWRANHGNQATLEYVLVSYTSEQFYSKEDLLSLHEIGKHAARAAGVNAYWLGCSCLGTEAETEQNVWRICDVVRSAFSVVVAVAGPMGLTTQPEPPYYLVREWGRRVWTLPELLLTPEHDDIRVYTMNRTLDSSEQLDQCLASPKLRNLRDFPRYWEDESLVGQLIDHYEGSVILSPLELITTALQCLQNRPTLEHLPGDLSYSLMGLLRQRPNVRRDDSAFQAFARLSLANDSNMLLERLICLLPQSAYDPWYSLYDHWGATLWDIYPKTQVCGIGENDTIILDGARAASIRWKSFARVILRGNDTTKRWLSRFALTICGPLLFTGIFILIVTAKYPSSSGEISGGILVAVALSFILLSPQMIKDLYFGKVWGAQPWFFGVEGYMSLPELERHLFGANLGRLSWSATGSSLSRHDVLKSQVYENFCEGQDPASCEDIRARIERGLDSKDGEEKVFTLVDTYTMTVTLFSAIKPPVAVLMCGEEGGMQRALLCSYEWTNNTLYRETVLRMETRAYWRTSPVGRVRLGLQKPRKLEEV